MNKKSKARKILKKIADNKKSKQQAPITNQPPNTQPTNKPLITTTPIASQTPIPNQQLGVALTTQINRIPLPKVGDVASIKQDVLKETRAVSETYPLVVVQHNKQKVPLAHATIHYNPQNHQIEYFLSEPKINVQLKKIIDLTIEELHEQLEIDFSKFKAKTEAFIYIDKLIEKIWKLKNIRLSTEDIFKVKYYIFREVVGLSKIDAIMQDPNLEDISCDGLDSPVFVFHRNPIYSDMSTNIAFNDKEELDSFVIKLAQKCNKTLSVAEPLLDGSLPDGSRLQVTFGTDIARRGSNFTIRKFFRVPLTPLDLINFKTADPVLLAYLWFAIEKEKSILISGTTASGKTTFLNAISMFINPTLKIVSIEDTPEIRLTHSNWLPQVTRGGFGSSAYGKVEMYDLLKSALRQRPDYLVVGEVRGREASVLFHAMSTGHASLSTLHADTTEAIIHRLTTRPIDLPLSSLENLDIIIFLEKVKKDGKFTRRVGQVIEVEGYNYKEDEIKTNEVFKWHPVDDIFNSKDSWILHQISSRHGMNEKEVQDEILRRAEVLKWMKLKKIYKFTDVAKYIHLYYMDPSKLAGLMKQ